jgi:uncharacterized protein YbcI
MPEPLLTDSSAATPGCQEAATVDLATARGAAHLSLLVSPGLNCDEKRKTREWLVSQPPGEAGRQAAAVANAISRLHREHYGRGAVTSRAIIQRNYVIVIMDDVYAPLERTLIEDGKLDVVRATRNEFQLSMKERFSEAIEQITGRPVVAFMSQVHFDPDLSLEFFMLEPTAAENAETTTSSTDH